MRLPGPSLRTRGCSVAVAGSAPRPGQTGGRRQRREAGRQKLLAPGPEAAALRGPAPKSAGGSASAMPSARSIKRFVELPVLKEL